MTMRTYRYFKCKNGHQGTEKTSENDQPYSDPWERISTDGLKINPIKDDKGYDTYLCTQCSLPMTQTSKPQP